MQDADIQTVSPLRMARISKGLTLMTVSKEIGVACPTLQGWEIGRVIPNLDYAVRLSRYYNRSLDLLFPECFYNTNKNEIK